MAGIIEIDSKTKILLAAKKLFALHGFNGTSVRQICEEAGVNIALVSYHFGGKENVFGALFDTFFPNERLADIDKDINPVTGVEMIIEEVTKYRYEEPELIRIIQQEIVMNTSRIDKIREHVMPIWMYLRHCLEAGQEQGIFQYRSLDSTLMSIIGTLLFYRNSEYWNVLLTDRTQERELLAEDLKSFILNGLQCKE